MKSCRARVAENITRKRLRKRLTQQRLADRIGIHRVSLSKLETGDAFPTPEHLDKLAVALETDVSRFFLTPKPLKGKK